MTLSPRAVVPLYRLGFGALVLVAITVQMVSLGQSGVLDPLHYLTFFTNLSNEIAAIVFLVGAARWRSDRSHAFDLVRGGAVVYMTITGVVFAVLLSGVNVDAQIPWVNDVVHELFPIVVMADWLVDPPGERLTLQAGNPVAGLPGCVACLRDDPWRHLQQVSLPVPESRARWIRVGGCLLGRDLCVRARGLCGGGVAR